MFRFCAATVDNGLTGRGMLEEMDRPIIDGAEESQERKETRIAWISPMSRLVISDLICSYFDELSRVFFTSFTCVVFSLRF